MNGTSQQTRFGTRLAAALAAGAFGALAPSGPAFARPDPGAPLPVDGAPQGVDVGLAKHGNMPPLTESESGTFTTSDDGGVSYVQIGLGALSGAAFTAAAVVVIGARRHSTPHPA